MPFPIELRLIATPERRPADQGNYGVMMTALDDNWPGRVSMLQVLWPDFYNRLPGEAGFDADSCCQTIYPPVPLVAGMFSQPCATEGVKT
jgi:hypothetical protein